MKDAIEHAKNATGRLLFDIVTDIPETKLQPAENPGDRVKTLINKACLKSATVSATLSVPGGFASVITALPDLATIWKIQSQLVADIAATYGKVAFLNREAMVWCLFRHSAAQLLRDTLVRTGTRFITQKISLTALQVLLKKIGIQQASKLIGKTAAKAVPLLGAVVSGAYAAYDTREVGKTAETYFKALCNESPLEEQKKELEQSENII